MRPIFVGIYTMDVDRDELPVCLSTAPSNGEVTFELDGCGECTADDSASVPTNVDVDLAEP